MERDVQSPLKVNVQEAAAALAAVDEQQQFVTAQLGRYRWHYAVLGLVLGLAAASLMWHNVVWFFVVLVLFLYGALRVVGTPARLGVTPREDGPGFMIRLVASFAVAFTAPFIALVGPRWAPLAVGGLVAVIMPALGWWKLAAMRADAARPPRTEPTPWSRLVTRVAPSPLYPPVLAVLMGAAPAVMASSNPLISLMAILVYLPGLFLLQGVSMKIGEIPSDRRPTQLRYLAVVTILVLGMTATPRLAGLGWWVPLAIGLTVAATVLISTRWQQNMLQEKPSWPDRRPVRPFEILDERGVAQ